MRSRKGHEYQHSGAGGLFITLAPLQTDVSFYFELALNRSLVSSVSHGLKTEGESGRDLGVREQGSPWSHVPPCQLLTSDGLQIDSPWLEVCWMACMDVAVAPRSEREDGRSQSGAA